MSTIRLREEVEKAVQSEWPRFRDRHPRLAAVLDAELMVEQAVRSLDEDDDYQQAMADATAEGLATDVLSGVVLQFVQRWLRRLV